MSNQPPRSNPTAASSNPIPPSQRLYVPPPINKIEETGLSLFWLQDLVLKVMYFQGYLTGFKIAEEIALPFSGVVDQICNSLKTEKLIEVRSSQMGLGEGAYQYAITGAGIARRVKRWNAANMPVQRLFQCKPIMKRFAGRAGRAFR